MLGLSGGYVFVGPVVEGEGDALFVDEGVDGDVVLE